ncbi:MAG: phospholipase D family protein [Gemmatimonadota bacterium]
MDRLIAAPEAAHPGQSGFRLVSHGPEALILRARSALLAGRSLDVQTYIWHADLTGRFLAHRILEAADRGVQVRLLVDDMDARAKNQGFAALDAHPRIQVRMFNPFQSRSGMWSRVVEIAGRFPRLNRRMHNKTWIADNRLAVVGGRNLGDEYFGGDDEVNFFDLDFALVGPVVRQASASFDRYWNAPVVRPMRDLDPDAVTDEALRRVRKILESAADEALGSRFAGEVQEDGAVQRLVAGDWPMDWTDTWEFVSDDPRKVTLAGRKSEASRVISVLAPTAERARESLTLISPYFVPGELGTRILLGAAEAGRRVRVLTNSLVANDVAAVHGGYSRYREALLKGGVELWELKPASGHGVPATAFGTTGASLHTKAMAVDGRQLFVGSYNIDPRSRFLNCEQGVMAVSPALARQLESIFERQTSESHAWQVRLDEGGRLEWSDGGTTYHDEPHASPSRKLQAWLARVLPVEAQL